MHRFTLALIGSIKTFILQHYFLRSMLLVTTLLNGWLLQLNNFQEHGSHGYCGYKHHSMSDVVLIVDPLHVFWWQRRRWSDTRFFQAAICVFLKDCCIWWMDLVAVDSVDDYPRESHLPSELPASVSKTAKWILLPFLYLSKVIYTRLELLLSYRYGSNKLSVPT